MPPRGQTWRGGNGDWGLASGKDQFWGKGKRGGRGGPGGAPGGNAAPNPVWWNGRLGRGFQRFSGVSQAQALPVSGPIEPEPMEPGEDCDISCVLEKRQKKDSAVPKYEYLCEWKDDSKESSWEERDELIKDLANKGAINQYEAQLLKTVKKTIDKAMENKKDKVLTTMLAARVKAFHETFNFIHLPRQIRISIRNMQTFLQSMAAETDDEGERKRKWKVTREGVLGERAQEQEQKELEKVKDKLRYAYVALIENVKEQGGKTEMSFVAGKWVYLCPQFNPRQHGFGRFQDFARSCPGIKVSTTGQNHIIELEDDTPEELKDLLEERRAKKEKPFDITATLWKKKPSTERRVPSRDRARSFERMVSSHHRRRDRDDRRSRDRSRDRRSRRDRSRDRRRRPRSRDRKKRSRSRKRSRDKKDKKKSRSRSRAKDKKKSRSESPKKKKRAKSASSDASRKKPAATKSSDSSSS